MLQEIDASGSLPIRVGTAAGGQVDQGVADIAAVWLALFIEHAPAHEIRQRISDGLPGIPGVFQHLRKRDALRGDAGPSAFCARRA